MKYSLIVAALLGAISQQELVEAINLTHRHHHHAKRHGRHHFPKDIGVRFIQNKDEGTSAADPDIVEGAAEETEALKVADENKAKDAQKEADKEEKDAAKKAEKDATAEVPAAEPEDGPVEPTNPEEYKALKKEVDEDAKKLNAQPADLPEAEQAEKEKNEVQALTDKADAERNQTAKKKMLDTQEKLLTSQKAIQKLKENPNDERSRDEVEKDEKIVKEQAKQLKKIQGSLAETDKAIKVDEEKQGERQAEADEEEAEEKKAEAKVAAKQKLLDSFKEKKIESDKKVTDDFAKQLPEYVPKSAIIPDNKKLKEGNEKIKAMFEADDKASADKAAEVQETKDALGPNAADAAIETKFKEFDEAKAAKAAEEAAAGAEKVNAQKLEKKNEVTEHAITRHLKGDLWVAAMPSYIVGNVPFRPLKHKNLDAQE